MLTQEIDNNLRYPEELKSNKVTVEALKRIGRARTRTTPMLSNDAILWLRSVPRSSIPSNS